MITSKQWQAIKEKNDGLVQDCSNSIVKALELLQSCTTPSKYRNINQT